MSVGATTGHQPGSPSPTGLEAQRAPADRVPSEPESRGERWDQPRVRPMTVGREMSIESNVIEPPSWGTA